MESAPYVLAIDLGTTAVKVAVVDDQGRVLGSANEQHHTTVTVDGGSEQSADEWWASIGRCARAATAQAGVTVSIVAVTAQYMSVVAVDVDGRPLAPVVMWTDRRGGPLHPLAERYDVWEQWLDLHGLIPLDNDDVGHIAVLRDRYPDHVDRLCAYVEPSDAIASRLVGRVQATAGTAFPLMCTDNRDRGNIDYSDALLEHAGLTRAVLPSIGPSDAPLGRVTADAASHLGISDEAVVMPATIDSVTSAIGCGAIDSTRAAFMMGTTAVMATHVGDKRVDLGRALSTIPSALPGQYFVMAENGMGGKALDLFLHQLVYSEDEFATGPIPTDVFERAERVARSEPPGANGVQFLPWLVGSIAPSPDDDVRAGFTGIGLSTTRAQLTRAVYEGVALNAAWLFAPFCEFVGTEFTELTFGGGGARSDLWAQILADACNTVVRQLADPSHANARGAALLAFALLGHIDLAAIPSLLDVKATYKPERPEIYAPLREKLAAAHAALPR